MSEATPADFTRDLVRWSEALAGIARTGLGFTQNLYERERFEEVLHVAADIKAAADEALEIRREQDH
ncbi:MAG: NUDIX hydrolase N-terminal domain-containing protein, partial [Actinomycetota bacterium]